MTLVLYTTRVQRYRLPEEGKLVVWPNFITHGSYPYTGKKNRVIVSANTTVSLLGLFHPTDHGKKK